MELHVIKSIKREIPNMKKINLAIVEDDILIKESLESYLGDNLTINIQFIATSVEDFLNALQVSRTAYQNRRGHYYYLSWGFLYVSINSS